ncbi:MAG: glycosyltransferase [Bacteroidales bacterium]|nr:glycosyltransferase [Bacteroidales bacterium]
MNILFVTENEISQQLGGTDRITITLANEFVRRGHNCYLAFCRRSEHPDRCGFKETLLLQDGQESEQLTDFLSIAGIDIIMSNLVDIKYKRRLLPLMYNATRGTKTRLIACYHAMPGEDLLGNRILNSIYRIRHFGQLRRNLKDIALTLAPRPLVMKLFGGKVRAKYRLMYDNSDLLVVLGEKAGRRYAEIAGLPYDSKFADMPNANTYDLTPDPEILKDKKKEVLIVARMDEKAKRLSFALKVWQRICESGKFDDWTLRLVGGGPDLNYLIRMADRLALDNIVFEGRVPDVLKYYRSASIFMLTSSFEGWALTVTESQQFGVVPVALDSYPSLHTLIENRKDGVIVPDNDLDAYTDELMWLMGNTVAREKIARSGMESVQRFTIEKVADRWLELFGQLQADNKEQEI